MIWFFQRGERRLLCEIRQAPHGEGFELVWTTPDGQFHVESYDDTTTLAERRKQVETHLQLDGWKRVGRITPPAVH